MEQASAVLSAQAGTLLYDSWYVWKNTQACVTCSTTNKCWSWFSVFSNWLILLHQMLDISLINVFMSIVLSQSVEHLHLIQSRLDLGQLMHCVKAHGGIFHATDFIYIYLSNRLTNCSTRHLENTLLRPLAAMAQPQRAPPVYSLIYSSFLFHLMPIRQWEPHHKPDAQRNSKFNFYTDILNLLGSELLTFGQFRFVNAAMTWTKHDISE